MQKSTNEITRTRRERNYGNEGRVPRKANILQPANRLNMISFLINYQTLQCLSKKIVFQNVNESNLRWHLWFVLNLLFRRGMRVILEWRSFYPNCILVSLNLEDNRRNFEHVRHTCCPLEVWCDNLKSTSCVYVFKRTVRKISKK